MGFPSSLFSLSFQGLLHSNRPSSEIEANETRSALLETQERIADIETQIAKLLLSRAALRTRARKQQMTLSPLRRLPPELLSIIFQFCIPQPESDPDDIAIDKTPLLLGSICSRWRAVTLSTPKLWASITLNLEATCVDDDDELVRMWLARSGSSALSVKMHSSEIEASTHYHVIRQLIPHCKRMQRLELFLPHCLVEELNGARNQMPNLKTLQIGRCAGIRNIPAQQRWPQPIYAFEVAPQLHKLEIVTHIDLTVPWHQLTDLTLADSLSSSACVAALRSCPGLVKCDLKIEDEVEDAPGSTVLELAHLQILIAAVFGESSFWEMVSFPSLCECQLRLDFTTFEDLLNDFTRSPDCWEGADMFIEFLERSECPLQKLTFAFSQVELQEFDLIACLKATPDLTELVLAYGAAEGLYCSSLEELTIRASQPCLVPSLQSLKFDQPSEMGMMDEELADMIRSRWMSSSSENSSDSSDDSERALLTTVEIGINGYSRGVDFESSRSDMKMTMQCLRQCRDEGMDAYVHWSEVIDSRGRPNML